jgi:hypothetical protein
MSQYFSLFYSHRFLMLHEDGSEDLLMQPISRVEIEFFSQRQALFSFFTLSCVSPASYFEPLPIPSPICKHIIMFYWIALERNLWMLCRGIPSARYLCTTMSWKRSFVSILFACYSAIAFIYRLDSCKFKALQRRGYNGVMLLKALRDFPIWSWKLNSRWR